MTVNIDKMIQIWFLYAFWIEIGSYFWKKMIYSIVLEFKKGLNSLFTELQNTDY